MSLTSRRYRVTAATVVIRGREFHRDDVVNEEMFHSPSAIRAMKGFLELIPEPMDEQEQLSEAAMAATSAS